MNAELKRLQKEINGKEVVYLNSDGDGFNAILLFPPDGNQISIKPYGYTDNELVSAMHKVGYDSPKSHIVRPEFCFTAIGINMIPALKVLANTPIGGKVQPSKIEGKKSESPLSPSCPYGK